MTSPSSLSVLRITKQRCMLEKCLCVFMLLLVFAEEVQMRNINIYKDNLDPMTNSDIEPNISTLIHLDTVVGNVTHFWKSTGFCPPAPHAEAWRWFSSESMVQNLLYIGALPFGAIRQVRMHWLLDLITVRSPMVYDMSRLDALLDRLRDAGLQPGFELMGNPGGIFSNLEDPVEVWHWSDLVRQVAKHYIGFLNYYDACAAGLRRAGAGLRLGGPGGECKAYRKDHYCWALLDHIHNGRDFFTGKRPYTPDFISIHKKGEDPNNTEWILSREETTISDIHFRFPNLSHVPIFNDEGDPLVGWSRPKWWRADVTYAAMLTKVIVEHHKKWFERRSAVNFGLLSNDNGFLSYQPNVFSQRSLLARFQINNTGTNHVQMVAKPAYSVMALLAMMGTLQLQVEATDKSNISGIGVLATRNTKDKEDPHQSDEWSIILYNSNDTGNCTRQARVTLTFTGLQPEADTLMVVNTIDSRHGNPYSAWVRQGRPPTPSLLQLARMRKEEGISRVVGPALFRAHQPLSLVLPQPAVSLVQICVKPQKPPQRVLGIQVHHINSGQALITWDDSSITTRCLLTYTVLHSPSGQRHTFKRINSRNSIFNYFVVDQDVLSGFPRSTEGFYRVRAVDLWGRKGPLSTAKRLK